MIKIKGLLEYTKNFIVHTWPALTFLIDLAHTKLVIHRSFRDYSFDKYDVAIGRGCLT